MHSKVYETTIDNVFIPMTSIQESRYTAVRTDVLTMDIAFKADRHENASAAV
jgi:hypothetical protein